MPDRTNLRLDDVSMSSSFLKENFGPKVICKYCKKSMIKYNEDGRTYLERDSTYSSIGSYHNKCKKILGVKK